MSNTHKKLIATVKREIKTNGLTRKKISDLSQLPYTTVQSFEQKNWGKQIETFCRVAEAVGFVITIEKI